MLRLSRPLAVGIACAILAGCGTTTVQTVTERVTEPSAASSTRKSTTTGDETFAGARTSNASSKAPRKRQARRSARSSRWVDCDSNVEILRPYTSCEFAQNAFYEYWQADGASPIEVHSPAAGRAFTTRCSSNGYRVTCRTGDGGRVRFSTAALDAYSTDQAASYASTHDLGAGSSSAVDAYPGSDATDDDEPLPDDDLTGDEIPNYDNGTGYRVQCADGMYSQSGGRPGACSGHGGVR